MNKKLEQAREWAARTNNAQFPQGRHAHAAAEIIQSLPDKWVDAAKVYKIITDFYMGECFDVKVLPYMEALGKLTIPDLPSFSDMTQEKREACEWMQAQYGTFQRVIITAVGEKAVALLNVGGVSWIEHESDGRYGKIVPLPDLPKLKWPGSAPKEPYLFGGTASESDLPFP